MSKRKWVGLLAAVLLITMLCGCHKEPEPIYDNHLRDLPFISPSCIRDEWEIPGDIWDQEIDRDTIRPTYNDLLAAGAVSVLRFNEGRYYSVSRISDGSYLFVLYKEVKKDVPQDQVADQLVIADGFRVKQLLPANAGRLIKICFTPKDSVPLWDPNGYYVEGGDENNTPTSYHRFADRSTWIFFSDRNEKNEWVVTFAGALPDSNNSVFTYMLDEDLALVS